MAVFIDIWPCLFTSKLSYAQLFKWGHSKPCVCLAFIDVLPDNAIWDHKILYKWEWQVHSQTPNIKLTWFKIRKKTLEITNSFFLFIHLAWEILNIDLKKMLVIPPGFLSSSKLARAYLLNWKTYISYTKA